MTETNRIVLPMPSEVFFERYMHELRGVGTEMEKG
jgi:hypothetical protein